jgi:alpha-galactosidase
MKKIKIITYVLLPVLLWSCSQSNLNSPKTVGNSGSIKNIAPTPPMGWNSWNCFGTEVNEEQIKAVADYMAGHMKEYGWEYVVVDAGWYHPPTFTTHEWNEHPEPPQLIDEYGRLLPDPVKFPSSRNGKGFKPLADYVHGKGLKFGIHIMRGIPWNAVAENTPIKGANATAKDVVEYNNRCEWVNVMHGINMTHPAGYEYYRSILELYADWGVDFIKADDMSRPYRVDEVHALSKAMQESGRDMVLSLSPGAATIMAANDLRQNAHMWRISNDFWDSWELMLRQFNYTATWAPYIAENHWPDADMLPIGKLRKNGVGEWEAGLLNEKPENVKDEYSRFSKDEQYTMMNLWSIFKSPLMMGGYLPENDEFTLHLLTNADVLRVNQHSVNNRVIKSEQDHIIWTADDRDGKSKYLAMFNIGNNTIELTADLSELEIRSSANVQELWSKENVEVKNYTIKTSIRPHASVMLKITPETEL